MKVRSERVASVELLSFLDYLSIYLFSLSLSKTLRQDFSHPSKVIRVAVVPNTMTVIFQLVAFPSLSRTVTVTVFAMHFISWEEGEKQEMFSSRRVRGCHVLPSTIRPSSNWIRGITRIASHSKNLMRRERITMDSYLQLPF